MVSDRLTLGRRPRARPPRKHGPAGARCQWWRPDVAEHRMRCRLTPHAGVATARRGKEQLERDCPRATNQRRPSRRGRWSYSSWLSEKPVQKLVRQLLAGIADALRPPKQGCHQDLAVKSSHSRTPRPTVPGRVTMRTVYPTVTVKRGSSLLRRLQLRPLLISEGARFPQGLSAENHPSGMMPRRGVLNTFGHET
jgi:hypothetical protein